MKKLTVLKHINDTFTDTFNELLLELKSNIKDAKHEYQQNVIEEKNKLLIDMCIGEGLDIEKMKVKYLKPKELSYIEPNEPNKNVVLIDDNLLDKITINDKDYYYEPENNGKVFDTNNNHVGIYKNGNVIFNV
jgi:hypothetical protein